MDANIRAYAEVLAANNYKVFIPCLFWRDLSVCKLNSNNDTNINKSLDIIRMYDLDKSFEDISMCLKLFREMLNSNGFGIGANLTYLA